MADRPNLDNQLDEKTFRSFYYLKEKLVDFCRKILAILVLVIVITYFFWYNFIRVKCDNIN